MDCEGSYISTSNFECKKCADLHTVVLLATTLVFCFGLIVVYKLQEIKHGYNFRDEFSKIFTITLQLNFLSLWYCFDWKYQADDSQDTVRTAYLNLQCLWASGSAPNSFVLDLLFSILLVPVTTFVIFLVTFLKRRCSLKGNWRQTAVNSIHSTVAISLVSLRLSHFIRLVPMCFCC
jgi:hypothetical protein